MFKLMIADDNPYTLQKLAESTDWENFDFYLAGTFTNGKELLDAAKENIPDLVITDISMPIMNGIQLSSEWYLLKQDMKIIFISSYSEFEYARVALKLHIFDYILKPIVQSQFLDVCARVLEELRREHLKYFELQKIQSEQDTLRRIALRHYISKLFFHAENERKICEELSRLGITVPESPKLCVVYFFLNNNIQLPPVDYLQFILENKLEDAHIITAMIENRHGAFLLLFSKNSQNTHDLLSRLCIDIETMMNLCISMIYSDTSEHFTDIPILYEQSRSALQNMQETNMTTPVAYYADIRAASKETASTYTFSQNIITMRDYIEKHYMEPINTSVVAQTVYLSPSYANHCFTTECGTTIFGYIIECRINKAKQLLCETDEQIIRIAELVGYSGKTSFYLAFKRSVGISPTEYRQENTKN
ncbi:MAG: response regulator [Lachnospiraceae bacterium]|nr:response regulator [Lachnospiraceae bacterium]